MVVEEASRRAVAAHQGAEGVVDGETGRRRVLNALFYLSSLLTTLQNTRTRESSVTISPTWRMLEEIEFHRLMKLRLEVEEPDDL